MRTYSIQTNTGVILSELSKEDLRGLQDCISGLFNFDDTWQGFETESGAKISITNAASPHWHSGSVGEIRRFIDESCPTDQKPASEVNA